MTWQAFLFQRFAVLCTVSNNSDTKISIFSITSTRHINFNLTGISPQSTAFVILSGTSAASAVEESRRYCQYVSTSQCKLSESGFAGLKDEQDFIQLSIKN
jgi:hypothetical protein